jgi:hypothetical protein
LTRPFVSVARGPPSGYFGDVDDTTTEAASPVAFDATKLAVQEFQVRRLKRDFRDLRLSPEYGPFSEFFATEIYSARDFTERNESFRKLTTQFRSLLGDEIYSGLMRLLDLHSLTDRLDDETARALVAAGAPLRFTEHQYEGAYLALDNYDERRLQIDLIVESLGFTHRVSQMPLVGVALKSARLAAGFFTRDRSIELLEHACATLRNIRSVDPLVAEIRTREVARLDRIFGRA